MTSSVQANIMLVVYREMCFKRVVWSGYVVTCGYINNVLEEYDRIIQILGPAGASGTAAREMVALLKK